VKDSNSPPNASANRQILRLRTPKKYVLWKRGSSRPKVVHENIEAARAERERIWLQSPEATIFIYELTAIDRGVRR
jgi:hypothetical protein